MPKCRLSTGFEPARETLSPRQGYVRKLEELTLKITNFWHVDHSREILKSYHMFNFLDIIKLSMIVFFHLLCLYITDKALKNDFNIKIHIFFIWSDDFKFPLLWLKEFDPSKTDTKWLQQKCYPWIPKQTI